MNIFEKNRVIFEVLEHYISKMERPEDIQAACITAGQYAMHRNTGYYSSRVIEEAYQKLAIEDDFGKDYTPGTVLVVYTENPEGGYINCVRNIINTYGSKMKVDTFNVLYDNKKTIEERAKRLKEVASRYERILICPNFLDPIYIMAFAKNFYRPVISFNLCNTIFNIGDSIADLWLDGGHADMRRSIEQRGIDASRVGLFPLKSPHINVPIAPIEEARKLLGIPEGCKLIFSCGGWHKYLPGDSYNNFFQLCKSILESREDVYIIVAGFPPEHCPFINDIQRIHPRFRPTGYVSREVYWNLMNTCDIYLDSFPINGCTTLVEAGLLKKPIVALHSRGATHAAFFKDTSPTIGDAVIKVNQYLNGELQTSYEDDYEKYHGSGWHVFLEKALEKCPSEHKLWEVKPNPNNPEVDLDVALSRENNTEWILYFNDTILLDRPDFELLRIIQRFSIEVNRGLTYKRYI